ncbi:OmdA domain containing protein [Streptomyces microflavus DSM 40593]|uniref:OmdA domain containing protein n=1 Tax=Streptomyces microflavus DSM 40593 TaxID=1303692 RepID=N0CN55_STRMI|nr:YdeI/OmpD-associated family protein [Streptomyces microflavus]AGK77025.1 OmdA domain containing protein [Streptomyces microflavus DSM 40593]
MQEYEDGVDILVPASPAELEAWLDTHHGERTALWVKIAKKHTGIPSLTWEEMVDTVLCFGWIDGLRRGFDDTYFLQRTTPRSPRSAWSQVNVAKAEALIAAGRMRPRGLAEIEAARADGRWETAYASQRNATAPPDLVEALDANPAARAFYETLSKSDQFALYLRLVTARTKKTRLARLEQMMAAMAKTERPS